ncbi:YqzE family protein [Ammoniphilus resinae]|uniref:YqzE family protein n=1 Tax=Ammoniphilus resinae TaxID=861532 RepID=A0ABS4GRD0_9BACL|nr:YqzE family protein [Ammoniphilus resinae]MBP1932823.1 hypothetical protein [Ammoniphilus resinae]
MSSNDIVKYITQEFVKYIDTPKNERKKRMKRRGSTHWFGMIPLALRMVFRKKKAKDME